MAPAAAPFIGPRLPPPPTDVEAIRAAERAERDVAVRAAREEAAKPRSVYDVSM